MNHISIISKSEAETAALGQRLAASIRPNDVVALAGPLGAGKTRAIAEALGVDPGAISSPTFVLIHEYAGVMPVFHFDLYRLCSPREFESLGAAEYFEAGGVCLIEWADRVEGLLPPDAWRIQIVPDSASATGRVFQICGPRAVSSL
jgi:tRNA threonylcarbamoyladenosine biosynthesis protein TsaE